MRIRFTKPDEKGEVKQYLVEQDTRDIPLKDLSGMSMQQADALMQQWSLRNLRRRRYSALRCDDAAPTGGVQRIFHPYGSPADRFLWSGCDDQ